jgi:hypothetical protein
LRLQPLLANETRLKSLLRITIYKIMLEACPTDTVQ